ncbi:hypothetical protein JCM10512_3850 [Bacteroides reticulotermitis JCM 10512]|uniref:Uncharacterized protein n=1 Tax=Bacteroides reticulotermitis JCM 10512 TaxID=1445607 RepID=W4UW38_9BACE|nr:hypothetical protein JCM10512_3850 [Bacteroides reticulotermitis JCM 10512]
MDFEPDFTFSVFTELVFFSDDSFPQEIHTTAKNATISTNKPNFVFMSFTFRN